MKTKILSILMVLMVMTLALTGCNKQVSQEDVTNAKEDTSTIGVTNSINDANNLTTLDDTSLDQTLGSADKTLMNW